MSRIKIGFGIVALLAAGVLWWQPWSQTGVRVRGGGDVLTIAATGDSLLIKPTPSGLGGAVRLLRGSSVAMTNLEENLLDPAHVPRGGVRWPYGTERAARDLRAMGFTMISLANNHAVDYGVDAVAETEGILDQSGLLHAGAGEDLAAANAAVFAGKSPRRVAIISVAISASPESRATPLRREILGRPGVNMLRYTPEVTADAATFAVLKNSPAAGSKTSDDQLTVSGTTVKKGSRTVVEMIADEGDTQRILAEVRRARADTAYVVLTVHSHEPGNRSQAPAEFLKSFARAAIDAGASMVVGHGPHQLRGIEVYKRGVIFYSLGNFIADRSQVDPRSVDDYDAGMDLYRLALGAVADSEQPPPQADSPLWWESVIATGRFEHGMLRSVQLYPIDLGVNLPLAERGFPRLAGPELRKEILDRLTVLSRDFGTQIRSDDGTGIIDLQHG